MLGLIVPILITIYVYKQAKENGRNPIIWAAINLAVIFGVQIIIGLALGLTFGAGSEILGWEENTFEKWTLLINLVTIVISLCCSYFFVVRPVTRVPDQQFISPPQPPKFD